MFKEFEYLIRRQFLRTEHELNAHLLEQQLVLGGEKVLVINPGSHFLRSQVLGQKGADNVDILRNEWHDGDEQVSVADISLPHSLQGRGMPLDGDHVGDRCDVTEPLRVVVYNGYVVGFLPEHLRQV